MSFSGTRSTEMVRDDGQTDFIGALWAPVARMLNPDEVRRDTLAVDELHLPSGRLVVRFVRHLRARRYRLLFRRDGTARCTVPRRGTLREARRFVTANESWLAERLKRHQAQPPLDRALRPGDGVLLDGVEVPLILPEGVLKGRLGDVEIPIQSAEGDLRPFVEKALRRLAVLRLPARTVELAVLHGLAGRLTRVSVRNQSTRWGSCSVRGVISLNWRLLQTPVAVRDYIILHELAHLVHLNHSPKFWALVKQMCPEYEASEAWLKRSGRSLL
ncbi:MAG: hypothetical protein RIS76_4088 [Verrucomicrobiota bacterium]